MAGKPERILLAKVGLDGHSRGIHVVAKALTDAGYEVIYTGIRRTPEEVACAALEEDAAAVGLSCLSGAHLALFEETSKHLAEKGADNVTLLCGGIIPDEDFDRLRDVGFEGIFTPGTRIEEILAFLAKKLGGRK